MTTSVLLRRWPRSRAGRLWLPLLLATLLLVLGLAPAASALSFVSVRREGTTTQAYAKFEYRLGLDQTFANPFDLRQIRVWATVTRPSGQVDVVPAFWFRPFRIDDVRRIMVPGAVAEWAVRYTPTETGRHTIRFEAQAGSAAAVSSSASQFVAATPAAGARGFVRISRRDPGYYEWSRTGRTLFAMGLNIDFPQFRQCDPAVVTSVCSGGWEPGTRWPPLVVADGSALSGSDLYATYAFYRDALTRLADAGGTSLRIRNDSWWLPLELRATGPGVPDYPNGVPGFGIGRYHQGNAAILDHLLALAEQRGIAIQINTWNANSSEYRDADYALAQNEDLVKRRLTYHVARWGYSTSLLAYEYWNEIDTAITKQPFWTDIRNWHHSIDTNQHVITNSHFLGSIRRDPVHGFDTDDVHAYSFIDADIFRVGDFSSADKPTVLSEYGTRRYSTLPLESDPTGVKAREGLWLSLVSHKSGAMYWWTSVHVAPLNLYERIFRAPATFLQGEDFAARTWVGAGLERVDGGDGEILVRGMLGDGAFLNAFVVRTPSSELSDRPALAGVVLRATGVRPGSYRVKWYDHITGAVIRSRIVAADAQGLPLAMPAGITRAVAVKAIPL